MSNEIIMKPLAIGIERDLCYEYDCDRSDLGGIANSDHILRVGFFHGMAMVLAKYYDGTNIVKIDDFLQDNYHNAGKRMVDIKLNEVEDTIKQYKELYKSLRDN